MAEYKAEFSSLVARNSSSLEDFVDEGEFTGDGTYIKYLGSYAFYQNTRIKNIKLPGAIYNEKFSSSEQLFGYCDKLETVELESFDTIPYNCFNHCDKLKSIKFSPNLKKIKSYSFQSTGFKTLEISNAENDVIEIAANAFFSSGIQDLIIDSLNVATINNTSLVYCPISRGDGAIYVPENVIQAYQEDQKWAQYKKQIYPIKRDERNQVILKENYDTIQDDWEVIINNSNNKPNNFPYEIGDTKSFSFILDGTEYTAQMRIVALDTDIINSNETAKITWMSNYFFPINKKVYTYDKNGQNYISWQDSELRTFLNSTLFEAINDSNLKNGIKEVKKISTYGKNGTEILEQITSDLIWIPSCREMNITPPVMETNGVIYNIFSSDYNRYIRRQPSNTSNPNYITRTSSRYTREGYTDRQAYYSTYGSGYSESDASANTWPFIFGFCT